MMRGSSFRQTKRRRTTSKALGSSSVVPVSAARAESNLAKKVVRIEKLVRGLKPEVKYFDLNAAFVNVVGASGASTSLVPIAQGSDNVNRIGDKIRVVSIQCFLRVATNAASLGGTPTDEQFCRWVIVQDKQTVSDSVATPSSIVASPLLPHVALSNFVGSGEQPDRFNYLYWSPLISAARITDGSLAGVLLIILLLQRSRQWWYITRRLILSLGTTALPDRTFRRMVLFWFF